MKYLIPLIFVITTSNANWKKDRENLEKVYIMNEFRLFYSLNGKDALKDITDSNKNQIPDIVENVAIQLQIANKLYKDTFNYTSPLEQPKYIQKEAKYIDIHFLETSNHGESGDGSILYDYKTFKNDSKALSITISNELKTGNLTPAHELFHSFQYGYSMFKNKWFIEGSARWSEKILEKGTGNQRELPQTKEEIHELVNGSYDTKYFWNRIGRICTKEDWGFTIPDELKDIKYIGTNQNVIEDNEIFGTKFIKILLENLDYYDNFISKEKGYEEFSWREFQQKDFYNNKYILLALKKSIEEIKPKYITEELSTFLNSVDEYLKEFEDNQNLIDLTQYIKDIGNPYEKIFKDGSEDIFSRNIWDMQLYDNKIYLGAGNAANSGPSINSGPLPLFSIDSITDEIKEEIIIEDEQIDVIKTIDNKLIIPGNDTIHGSKYGNFYQKDIDNWQKFKNIPNALHVFDITYFEDKLFAAIGTPNGAAITISKDFGKTWDIEYLGNDRFYSFLILKDKLYAIKRYPAKKDIDNLSNDELKEFFYIVKYEKNKFIPIKTIEPIFFKNLNIKQNDSFIIKNVQKIGDKTIYQVANNYLKSTAFYYASINNQTLNSEKINISPMYQIWDYIIRGNTIYFLTSLQENKKYKNIIFTIEKDNLIKQPRKYFSFYSDTFARSFEEINGNFYFGLGVNIKSQKKWTLKELHEDTGKILKIEKQYITRD